MTRPRRMRDDVTLESALAPIGGMWRDDKVLVFGDQAKGKAIFARLFNRDALGHDANPRTAVSEVYPKLGFEQDY